MVRFRLFVFLSLLLVLPAFGPARADDPLRVVASFSVLADLVAQVGGEDTVVTNLIPMGDDPHVWQPGPYDIESLAEADLVVVNGMGLEDWLDRLVADSGYKGPILVASRGIEPLYSKSGVPDPHAWHSLAAARAYASEIAVTLIGSRPARAEALRGRLREFLAELDILDRWARHRLYAIPAERRVIVTGHNAFAWLGRDFGIRILSPTGLDSLDPLPTGRMDELVAEVRAAGVGAVFLDAISDPSIGKALQEGAHVTVGASLYADTLSPECSLANSYLSMWQNNFALMTEAMMQ